MTQRPLLSIIIPVYNGTEHARATANAIAAQNTQAAIELIIVDDGSDPPLAIEPPLNPAVRFSIIRLPENAGRSAALNAGVAACTGRYITFLDADCIPNPSYLTNLTRKIGEGLVLIQGHIDFQSGDKYFDRYENANQNARRAAFTDWELQLTTANVTLRRDLVVAIGGFSERYRRYGFEDRDFLIRLKQAFPDLTPSYADDCSVTHVDVHTLAQVLRKFYLAGQHTAAVFRNEHPQEYKKMSYHYFDAQFRSPYRFIPAILLNASASLGNYVFATLFHVSRRNEWFRMADASLKLLKGLSFLRGTLMHKNAHG